MEALASNNTEQIQKNVFSSKKIQEKINLHI